jgi:glycosyltransferase involved in cell wall biosynthesis
MPRVGQNPAKFSGEVSPAQRVTVAVLSYIPFLQGYYRHSLKVLQLCISSVIQNTELAYDLMVFDNGSCREVQDYLLELKGAGKLQFLMLSGRNVGKVGAWNFIFGSAPGEYVAYADGDVYFFPGWLSKHLEVFESFPDVGTVTGVPRRRRSTFMENSLERVHQLDDVEVETGKFIPEHWIKDHARSLDKLDSIEADLAREDVRLTSSNGVQAFVTAQHYQFVIGRETIQQFLPFAATKPMGSDVAQFDEAIESSGLLRLAVSDRTVLHIGNTIDQNDRAQIGEQIALSPFSLTHKSRGFRRILTWPPIRRLLLAIYDRIFLAYFSRSEGSKTG